LEHFTEDLGTLEHFTEDLGTFYWCRRHKFAIKLFPADPGLGAVGGHPIASIAVSYIAGGIAVCLLWVLCAVR
jgi:hypothetical protein